MSGAVRFSSGSIAGAVAVVFVIAVGLALVTVRDRLPPVQGEASSSDSASYTPDPGSQSLPENVPEAVGNATPDEQAAGDNNMPEAARPGFDLVRMEGDGGAVVAGHAEPGATVTIYADGEPLAESQAGPDGQFVALFDAGAPDGALALTLGATGSNGDMASEDVVMLLPPADLNSDSSPQMEVTGIETPESDRGAEDAGQQEEQGSADIGTRPKGGPSIGNSQSAESRGAADPPTSNRPSGPSDEDLPTENGSATVLLHGGEAQLLSRSVPDQVKDSASVSLLAISYSEAGEVVLSGYGGAGASIRAYVDNSLAGQGSVGDSGHWALTLSGLESGLYRLRIDQLDQEGQVTSRVETPFQRDFPGQPRPRPDVGQAAGAGVVTVQPGGNLWTIARDRYGSGFLYTQIFAANSRLIRDPELIYPGQVLAVPDLQGTE